jgi:hypothetical protein
MIFEELHTKVNAVIDSIDNIMIEAAISNKEEIADLNISQLEKGITSKGTMIEPEYANEDYARLKKAMGSRAPKGTPDLKFEGDFYSGFFVERKGDQLLVDSSDEKSFALETKYEGIFGIAPENSENLTDIIIEDIKERVLDEITG